MIKQSTERTYPALQSFLQLQSPTEVKIQNWKRLTKGERVTKSKRAEVVRQAEAAARAAVANVTARSGLGKSDRRKINVAFSRAIAGQSKALTDELIVNLDELPLERVLEQGGSEVWIF